MGGDVTRLLDAAAAGDDAAAAELYELAYDELKRIAHAQLRRRIPGQTLQTTALVHEAYVKLFDGGNLQARDRAHFFALSARAMRQILVDAFREKRTEKRGALATRFSLLDEDVPVEQRGELLIALDGALDRLAQLSPRMARVVECRFFGGMSQEEVAEALGITDRTVRREWSKARAYLVQELGGE